MYVSNKYAVPLLAIAKLPYTYYYYTVSHWTSRSYIIVLCIIIFNFKCSIIIQYTTRYYDHSDISTSGTLIFKHNKRNNDTTILLCEKKKPKNTPLKTSRGLVRLFCVQRIQYLVVFFAFRFLMILFIFCYFNYTSRPFLVCVSTLFVAHCSPPPPNPWFPPPTSPSPPEEWFALSCTTVVVTGRVVVRGVTRKNGRNLENWWAWSVGRSGRSVGSAGRRDLWPIWAYITRSLHDRGVQMSIYVMYSMCVCVCVAWIIFRKRHQFIYIYIYMEESRQTNAKRTRYLLRKKS